MHNNRRWTGSIEFYSNSSSAHWFQIKWAIFIIWRKWNKIVNWKLTFGHQQLSDIERADITSFRRLFVNTFVRTDRIKLFIYSWLCDNCTVCAPFSSFFYGCWRLSFFKELLILLIEISVFRAHKTASFFQPSLMRIYWFSANPRWLFNGICHLTMASIYHM